MTDKKDFEAWKVLFQKEQKGMSPDEMAYHPISEISIPPYTPGTIDNGPYFPHTYSHFVHSFHIDNNSAIWLTELSDELKGYLIESTMGKIKSELDEKLISSFGDNESENKQPKFRTHVEMPLILNFRDNDVLTRVKKAMTNFEIMGGQSIAIIPGDDFILNVGLIRGIQKYMNQRFGSSNSLQNASIFIPVHDGTIPGDESLLIPLTNQFLSLMVVGIHRCIWDIRRVNEWQKANLTYLLNVPELLVREGKIFQGQDVIYGSGLFEELSDQVHQELIN